MPDTTYSKDGKIDTFTIETTGTYEITAIGATGGAAATGQLGKHQDPWGAWMAADIGIMIRLHAAPSAPDILMLPE